MKNKILMFIIGMLVGAIITTLGFYLYDKNKEETNEMSMPQFEMKNGPQGEMSDMGEPPAKPGDSNMNSSTSQRLGGKPSSNDNTEN